MQKAYGKDVFGLCDNEKRREDVSMVELSEARRRAARLSAARPSDVLPGSAAKACACAPCPAGEDRAPTVGQKSRSERAQTDEKAKNSAPDPRRKAGKVRRDARNDVSRAPKQKRDRKSAKTDGAPNMRRGDVMKKAGVRGEINAADAERRDVSVQISRRTAGKVAPHGGRSSHETRDGIAKDRRTAKDCGTAATTRQNAERSQAARRIAARREAERQRVCEERARRRKDNGRRAAAAAKEFALCFAVFALLFSFICAVFAVGGDALMSGTAAAQAKKYYYETAAQRKVVSSEDLFVDGVICVNFSDIAYEAGLTESADGSVVTFSTADGERARFTVGSREATVNGNSVIMACSATRRSDGLYLSADFTDDYLSGVDVELLPAEGSAKYPTLRITVGEDVGFLVKKSFTIDSIDNSDLPPSAIVLPADTPRYEFTADLSKYLQYLDPTDRASYLVLVNKSERIDEDAAEPEDLTEVLHTKPSFSTKCRLRLYAAKSVEAMFTELYTVGFEGASVNAGYRTYDAQAKIFDNERYKQRYYYRLNYASTGEYFSAEAYSILGREYINAEYVSKDKTTLTLDDAERVASSYCPPAGASDYHTGLTVSIYPGGAGSSQSDLYEWLLDNAYKFGFVQRYPEGKEQLTGMPAETMTWRFVGQYHAAVMHENGLCLEEYVELLRERDAL